MGNEKEIWCRLGAYVEVDEELFNKEPVETLETAILSGNFYFDGESYVPEGMAGNEEEIQIDIRAVRVKKISYSDIMTVVAGIAMEQGFESINELVDYLRQNIELEAVNI